MNAFFELFNQYNKALTTAISVLLVILMSLSLANGVLFIIENLNDTRQQPSGDSAQPFSLTGPGQNYNLAKLNLFGSEKAEDKTAPAAIDAPKTSLNLELQGVFTADNPEDSTAIVAQKGKSGELKSIGDKLPGNATLNAVFDDHILIKRGTRIEKLSFIDTPTTQQFLSTQEPALRLQQPAGSDQPSASRLRQVRERIAKRSQEIAQSRSKSRSGISKPTGMNNSIGSKINAYQERLNTDPQSVLSELGMSAISDTDSSGYRIGSEVSQTVLRQAGLQKGDVILSVNGRPVGNIANDKALIDQTIAAKRVRVEVQRDTRRFFVTVPIPQ